MISWIRSQKWLSATSLALFSLLLFGGADLLISPIESLLVSVQFSAAVLFSTRLPWVSIVLIISGAASASVVDLSAVFSGISVLLALLLISAFGTLLERVVTFWASLFAGLASLSNIIFVSDHLLADFGLSALNASAPITLFAFGSLLMVCLNLLAWIFGRLLITRSMHVGTAFDRAVSDRMMAKLSLEIAEQNARFDIARDISEQAIQAVSATVSLSDGGLYSVAADPSSANRAIANIAKSARVAHRELRRLFDMLNKVNTVRAVRPRLSDLETLVVAYRELGFNLTLRHDGDRFEISEGAELAVYRIAFDALENVKKHAPIGTDVAIDFSWTGTGMQLLIKDNGIEVANRKLSLEELAYTVEEDRKALTESIRGAGITAMSERAALYGGSVEVTRVPGVGFTISAIFPNLRELTVDS